ncbi:hypothetical protein QTP86_001803, partial [Hemibagrus guttatus]
MSRTNRELLLNSSPSSRRPQRRARLHHLRR